MTSFSDLIRCWEREASDKWCKYYPNKHSYSRTFELWPRGKAVLRLLQIQTKYDVKVYFAGLGVNKHPASEGDAR